MTPAFLTEDGRIFAGPLNEARDLAAQLAGDLDQLDTAGDGLSRVQRLVGRLRDVAVVSLDGALQPAQRAALQRQVDLTLAEIDTVANGTQVEERLLPGIRTAGAGTAAPGPGDAQKVPFQAIGAAKLGLTDLAVRSADQAYVATGALDLATGRLQRHGRGLSAATARLQRAFDAVTNPRTTVAGDPALTGETNALGSTIILRGQLTGNPDQAVQAQTELDASRVRWLLDAPTL
jgi:flagellin-like hook-associated protein FlgL